MKNKLLKTSILILLFAIIYCTSSCNSQSNYSFENDGKFGNFVLKDSKNGNEIYYHINIGYCYEYHEEDNSMISYKIVRNLDDSFELITEKDLDSKIKKSLHGKILSRKDKIIELKKTTENNKIETLQLLATDVDVMDKIDNSEKMIEAKKKLEEEREKMEEKQKEFEKSMKSLNVDANLKLDKFDDLFANMIDKSFDFLKFSETENKAVELLLESFKTFDKKDVISKTSEENKTAITQFLDYIFYVYGSPKSFMVIGRNFYLAKSKDNISRISVRLNYKDDKKFDFLLRLKKDGNKFIYEDFKIEKYFFKNSIYLEELYTEFFKLFKEDKFDEIYKICGKELKKVAHKEQIISALATLKEKGGSANFKLFQHAFLPHAELGKYIHLRFLAENGEQKILLALNYFMEDGKYRLNKISYRGN